MHQDALSSARNQGGSAPSSWEDELIMIIYMASSV